MPGDPGQQRVRLRAGQDGGRNVAERIKPSLSLTGFRIEGRIRYRHACLSGQDHDGCLVFLAEGRGAALLGEIDVAEDPAHGLHRRAEEGAHGWVIGREADRFRMVSDVCDANGSRLMHEQTEDSTPPRQRSDRLSLARRDAGGDELLEITLRTEHAERPVAGVGDLGGQIDDSLQDDRQREFGREREPDFQEKVLPVLWLAHRCESTPSHAGGQRRLLSPVGSSSLLVRVDRP